jgi:CheY-like chemotaxis protein
MINTIQNFIILDDDPDNNMLCAKTINKVFPKATVLTFTDPKIALSYIALTYESATAPDAVLLLDINMPVLNGWEFLNAFARFDIITKAHFRIYMLSSSFDERDKKRAAENTNVFDYIEKPLTREIVERAGTGVMSLSTVAEQEFF